MKDYTPLGNQGPGPKKKGLGPQGATLDWLSRFLTLAGLLLILVPLVWAPFYLSRPLRAIAVEGNRVLSAQEVAARLRMEPSPLWIGLDPYELETQILEEPWVQSVNIKKTSTLGLLVAVTERQPVAYFKAQNGLFLLDSDQMVLVRPSLWGGWDLPVFTDLNLKVNAGDKLVSSGVYRALELTKLLDQDPVLPLSAVSEFLVGDPMNLSLITQPGGLEVRLGFEGLEEKLARLHQASGEIKKREDRLAYIDLRHPQGIVIKRK